MWKTLAAALLLAALIPASAQALENEDLLALAAMPLAVAAVSEITDVPMNDLIDVVTLMNDAAVPPPQFIEVVRYAPAALVVETDEPFADFVRLQFDQGLRGPALVTVIEERMQLLGVDGANLDVTAPRVVDIDQNFVPVLVRQRVAEAKAHPHGGPPGQLKKERGVQTGAEIVHGTKPGKSRAVTRGGDDDDDRVVVREKPKKQKHDGGGDYGKGHGKGHGKGKGKGKG